MRLNPHAHTGQSAIPTLQPGHRIRSLYAGRAGVVAKVYPDGSAAVRWNDGEPQPEGLAHERMPRRLLVLDGYAEARGLRAGLGLIRQALRDAVAAPSDRAAMDVTAAALVALADLIRAEVQA